MFRVLLDERLGELDQGFARALHQQGALFEFAPASQLAGDVVVQPPQVVVAPLAELQLPVWQTLVEQWRTEEVAPEIWAWLEHDQWTVRAQAARAGASRAFVWPAERSRLLQAIALSQQALASRGGRVLVCTARTEITALQAQLHAHDIAVQHVTGAEAAWELVQQQAPDMLLVEASPQGSELVQVLRLDAAWREITVVYLSHPAQERDDIAWSLADAELVLPVSEDAVETVLLPLMRVARRARILAQTLLKTRLENQALQLAIDRHAIVSMTDMQGTILDANENFVRVSGYRREELLGKNHRIVKSGVHGDEFYRELWHTISRGLIWQGRVCNRRRTGEFYWVDATIVPLLGQDHLPQRYLSVRTDITDLVDANFAIQQTTEHLLEELDERHKELQSAQSEVLERLMLAAEYRDTETGNHIVRISRFAELIARDLGMPEPEIQLLVMAAPMHDVGKIGVPDHILLKPGRLTSEEFEVIKTHSTIGASILASDSSDVLRVARDIALYHHEKYDGTGYPYGLAGDEIPLVARIVAVADVFDAVTTVRPYKKAWPVEEAVAHIQASTGSHFDPGVVDAFMRVLPDILALRTSLADRHEFH